MTEGQIIGLGWVAVLLLAVLVELHRTRRERRRKRRRGSRSPC